MESIAIVVAESPDGVVFHFSTESGATPELLGILVDDLEVESTIWGLVPSDPHTFHPLDLALTRGHASADSPVLAAACNYIGKHFARALPLVTFGVAPEGFMASLPEGATGVPKLVSGRRYGITAFGPIGIGFQEFVAASARAAV